VESGKVRILIADNNAELCQTLCDFISEQEDMEVVAVAADGEAALHAISTLPIDVVILDIAMPRIDGMAVLEQLRHLNLKTRPRVIVLSALGREEIMNRLTDLGADYYVVKPINLEILAQRVRQFADEPDAIMNNKAPILSNPVLNNRDSVEIRITELLHRIGVPAHMKGYLYLRDAVNMVLEDDRLLAGGLTKRLYPMVADKYQSSAGGVEAAIRNVLTAWWERGCQEELNTRSGAKWTKIPTNSAMIAELADYIRFNMTQRRSVS
jgi:two-component system response regulator (stage 0 sporulation protein A)